MPEISPMCAPLLHRKYHTRRQLADRLMARSPSPGPPQLIYHEIAGYVFVPGSDSAGSMGGGGGGGEGARARRGVEGGQSPEEKMPFVGRGREKKYPQDSSGGGGGGGGEIGWGRPMSAEPMLVRARGGIREDTKEGLWHREGGKQWEKGRWDDQLSLSSEIPVCLCARSCMVGNRCTCTCTLLGSWGCSLW